MALRQCCADARPPSAPAWQGLSARHAGDLVENQSMPS